MRTTAVDTYATRNRTTDTTTVARPDPVVWGGPATDGPLEVTAVEEYDRRGFHTVDALLEAHDVAALLAETTRLGHELVGDRGWCVRAETATSGPCSMSTGSAESSARSSVDPKSGGVLHGNSSDPRCTSTNPG